MSPVVDQINAICQANLVAARQLATIALDSTENVVKTTLQATKKLVHEDNGQLGPIWSGNALPKVFTELSDSYQNNTHKVLEISRTYLENATKAQSELVRVIQDQLATANNSFLATVQEFANTPVAHKQTEEALERQKTKKVTA